MALVRDSALLLLGDPTNGRDPAGIEEIRDLRDGLAGQGLAISGLDRLRWSGGRRGVVLAARVLNRGEG